MQWIFYALIALFFGYLLFDAFGKPVGRSKPEPRQRRHDIERRTSSPGPDIRETHEPYTHSGKSAQGDDEFTLDEKFIAPGADRALIEAGLRDIYEADERFQFDRFLTNAKRTLELMLTSYQDHDRDQLKILLQTDLYEAFDRAITAAQSSGDNSRLDLIGIGEPRLVDAKVEDTMSVVTLTARLEQLVVKRDPDGADVEGLGETVIETAEYTFVRDVNSSAPNWFLRSIEDA